MDTKTYSELILIDDYIERYNYLRLSGNVGEDTFGYSRYLNQRLYTSQEWKRFRNSIILRDNACDMAASGHDIGSRVIIHHINPITIDDVLNMRPCIFDPDNVVCVSHMTHEAIHYGSDALLIHDPVARSPNDTCPWKI